jgi:hypothetical protein
MATVSPQETDSAPLDQPWTYTLRLPNDPRAARIARVTLRAVLSGHGMAELTETAELLTSEWVRHLRSKTDATALRVRSWLDGMRCAYTRSVRPGSEWPRYSARALMFSSASRRAEA